MFQGVGAGHDFEGLFYARGIKHSQRLCRQRAHDPGLARGNIRINFAVMLVHDCAGRLWIGDGILEPLHGGRDEAADQVRIGFNESIAHDDAIAIKIEAGVGIGQRKNLFGRRRFGEQRLADNELSNSVGATGREHAGQGVGCCNQPRHLAAINIGCLGIGVEQLGHRAERGIRQLLAFEVLRLGDAGNP